jgi:hypothetical protein
MGSVAALFLPIRASIDRKNREGGFTAGHQLTVNESLGLVDVEYRGECELWFDDDSILPILDDLLHLLGSPEVAPTLRSFTHRTDAALAANGTYSIIIDALFTGDQPLPRLSRFVLDQGDGEHGYRILASARNGGDGYYEEAGVLADLLARAPVLEELVTPSPPSDAFFKGPSHPLRSLDVDSGFDQASFIRNLAGCSRFPELRRLVFTDFRQSYLDDWREKATTFEDYLSLFASPVGSRLESISLREVSLTRDQINKLLEMRSKGVDITIAEDA